MIFDLINVNKIKQNSNNTILTKEANNDTDFS